MVCRVGYLKIIAAVRIEVPIKIEHVIDIQISEKAMAIE